MYDKQSYRILSSLLVLFISLAHVSSTLTKASTGKVASEIHWSSCNLTSAFGVPFTCGTLRVPLDYTDPSSNETLILKLAKVDAVKPKKGSILFNDGGPGQLVRNFISGLDGTDPEDLLVMTGGEYDLIGLDTRGTGDTIPFSCYTNPASRALSAASGPLLNSSNTATGTFWAGQALLSYNCYNLNKDTGDFIGTGFVARDLISIVDALNEDGLLRYWGLSYGTTLGVTVAAMFPYRIDKMVLDGVQNPHEYYAGVNIQGITRADVTYNEFFKGCLANPDNCALSVDGSTALELRNKVDSSLDNLKYHPIPLPPLGILADYSTIKGKIAEFFHNAASYQYLAVILHGLLNNNSTIISYLFEQSASSNVTSFPSYGIESVYGISCSDSKLRSNRLTTFLPLINEFLHTSQLFGDIFASQPMECATWRFHAKGGYNGDFRVKTKKPILILGSNYDPLTPLASAKNVSAGFEGSVLLQHNGNGHTSLSQPSLCVAKHIRSYFVNGTLPQCDTICEPSFPLFSVEGLNSTLAPISNSNLTRRDLGGSINVHEDEKVLLAAVMRMNRAIRGKAENIWRH